MGENKDDEGRDQATGPEGETATHAPTTPPDSEGLPYPGPATVPATGYTGAGTTTGGTTGTAGGGTTPSTGNLGSAGTPGGTT